VPKLSVVVCSTREGRAGLPIARWFFEAVQKHQKFAGDFVDLKEVNLPMMDEPNHPRLQKYTKPYTREWSSRVNQSDAFVFVTPEYNYGASPALLNALDYLYVEWNYKPAAFVSYGGLSGGTRAVQMTKMVLAALKMAPIVEAVNVPFFQKQLHDGVFKADEAQDKSAHGLLDELLRWSEALKTLRQ
jgi:NAD(P)H-dependent FMN reductase